MGSKGSPRRSRRGYGEKWKRWVAIYLIVGMLASIVVIFVSSTNGGNGGP